MVGDHAAKLLDVLRILHYFELFPIDGGMPAGGQDKMPVQNSAGFRNISSAFISNPHIKFNLSFTGGSRNSRLPVRGRQPPQMRRARWTTTLCR